MKVIISSLLLSMGTLFGQEVEHKKANWQRLHSDVITMRIDDYSKLTESQKDLLGSKLILFSEELSWSDIENYESLNNYNNDLLDSVSEEQVEQIKTWLFDHQDVKIISRSRFHAFTEAQQEKHLLLGTLILNNESLTIKDIEAYEINH